MEDKQIIELYWQRDEIAIEETSKKYGVYCLAIAENILNNQEDAMECLNDTWLKAWNAMPPQKPENLKLFLAKITRNLSLNRMEAQNAKKRGNGEFTLVLDELSECIASYSDVENTYLAKELGEIVRKFVRKLPEREGNVFVRRYFFMEPVAVIAKRYRMTENHVMVMLSRTRKKLKKYLVKEGYHIE